MNVEIISEQKEAENIQKMRMWVHIYWCQLLKLRRRRRSQRWRLTGAVGTRAAVAELPGEEPHDGRRVDRRDERLPHRVIAHLVSVHAIRRSHEHDVFDTLQQRHSIVYLNVELTQCIRTSKYVD